jgi:hypothetical protein
VSLSAQRFRETADASSARLSLAEEAISVLRGMLVEQDAALAAQAEQLQALHSTVRDGAMARPASHLGVLSAANGTPGQYRGPLLLAPSSSTARVYIQQPESLNERLAGETTLSRHSHREPAGSYPSPPSSAGPDPSPQKNAPSKVPQPGVAHPPFASVDALASKVDWLGHHVEQLVRQQQQKLQLEQQERDQRNSTADSATGPVQQEPGTHAAALHSSMSAIDSKRILELDEDYRARVETREVALRTNYESQVAVAVEAARLEVISRLHGLRSATGAADATSLLQLSDLSALQARRVDASPPTTGSGGVTSALDVTVHAALTAAREAAVEAETGKLVQAAAEPAVGAWGDAFEYSSNVSVRSPSSVYSTGAPPPAGPDTVEVAEGSVAVVLGSRGQTDEGGDAEGGDSDTADEAESWTYVLPQNYARI